MLQGVRPISLWISGVLNDVFVSGLPGLVGYQLTTVHLSLSLRNTP